MKTKTLLNEFFRYVILNICGMIGLSCYILADTFFIVQALVRDSFEKHGRIDAIVSSAGYGLFGCVEELTDEEIDHIIEVRCEGICAGCGNVRCSNRMKENAQMERLIQAGGDGGMVFPWRKTG